ncbi:breast cancer type 1 susceptibility protein homolog isoform X1 [Pygocentrus nattereri]|uniref:RING-type E3 ubiquitin transferase BRCA1 n=1 Tax=Pygocentrus nattereri TaxID=42514 RepID=A0A3B4DNZ1_PYGNA|nr:breast cancer type 1 susceptibility protein homolog isoform X1 [Pygocentrus nattereri]XP_017560039.2 breast cancer type 1 susceptibility protein homolog isoform X1 [Pygocentrus nattereri]XP_037399911.1 breast cancer type 1 susceptibility protein homolog isoform X1 [Pygocentrus nattereri]
MTAPKAEDVKRGIAVIWENLQCPICLDLMNAPVSTRCDHQFCKFCMMQLLEKSKRKEANCPVCKMKVTKRSLQESPGFQRLVEGLQNLVQSYEFDTCTSYFNGVPQKRKETSVETQSSDQQRSEENAFSESDMVEKSASRSSTAAAKDAFAKLMDLPASCPVSSEQDCSDSGVGDLPQVFEKKPGELEDVPSTLEVRQNNSLTRNDGSEDAETNVSQKRSSRRAKRIGLEPNRIVDKRQKKSVEKVAEWLLKISPSSDTQAKDNSEDLPTSNSCDSDRESICSSSSTVVNVKVDDQDDASPPRDVPGRGLEEQVFGAVYKRMRKGAKSKVNRSFSAERHIVTDPDHINLVVEEGGIKRNIPKRKRSCALTPADFIKKSSDDKGERLVCDQTEDPKESVVPNVEENKQDHIDESNTDGPLKCVEEHEKLVDNCLDEKRDDNAENIEASPVFEVPLKRPGRRSKIKMQDAWKDLGCELKKDSICDDKTGRKRRISRNNCESTKDGHLEESKIAKCAKSLTLVSTAGDEDVSLMKQLKSKPNLVEAEINIESYPSTAEPQSPDARKTRRSLRLQAFVAEVQGARKRRRSTQTPLKPAHGSENNPSQSTCSNQPKADNTNVNEDNANVNQGNASAGQVQSEQTETSVRKNGCVCTSSFEKIETMETVEEAATFTCIPEANVPDQSSLVSVVPDTADQGGQNVPCSSVAVSSPGPLVADAPDSTLPLKRQDSPSTGVVAPSVVQTLTDGVLMSAGENGSMNVEGDANDSELDTELLMKSFKGTKRKSFLLGSPEPLHAETQQDALEKIVEEEKQLLTEIPVISQDRDIRAGLANVCESEQPLNPCVLAFYEKQPQRSPSSFGNTGVASISILQAKSPALAKENQENAFLKSTTNSPSSGLSPNKVARSSQDSRLSTNSCQLFFVGTTQDVVQICSSRGLGNQQSSKLTIHPPRTSDVQKETQGIHWQTKVSLDPIKSLDIPVGGLPNSGVHSNNFESSITPDGLLPEGAGSHALQIIEPLTSQSLDKVKEMEAEILSQPCVQKKRKAQRLESSESDLSAEEDDLPTMAQIFKSHCSPSPSGQEEPLSDLANQDGHQLQEPNPGLQSPSQHSRPHSEPAPGTQSSQLSQCVSPSQNREHLENVNATTVAAAVQDVNLPEPPCREEWITSSQGSVDLFGTPEESEAVDGVCGNVALSRDSSQYSSEIINTQQKEEMQQELRRLERMMALVSEALQRKELDSGATAQTEEPDPSHSDQHTAADLGEAGRRVPGNPSDRQSGPDSGRDHVCVPPSPRAPDGLEAPQSHAPLTRGQAKTAGQQTGRGSQKSWNSRRRSLRKLEAGPEVKDHSVVSEDSPTGSMKGREAKEPQREASVSGRLGISSTAGKMELVSSGLSASELAMVKKFARKMHGSLSREMTPNTSHVIIKTDANLVCERTLKYFQGIAGRKWVVSSLWISECFKQGKVLDEAQFEVRGDVINGSNHNGPLKSRTTAYDNLLMKGYEICFQGSFTGMTTDQMEAMVEMCGATVMKDPLMFSKHGACQLVVVQPGSDDSQSYYSALQKKATVVTRAWLLDTIATYTLQNPEDYKP